jgi:hypothetical protein
MNFDTSGRAPFGSTSHFALRIGNVTARSTEPTWASSRRIRSKISSDLGQIRSGFVSTAASDVDRPVQEYSIGTVW